MVVRLPEKWSGLENILGTERKGSYDNGLGRRIILEKLAAAKFLRAGLWPFSKISLDGWPQMWSILATGVAKKGLKCRRRCRFPIPNGM